MFVGLFNKMNVREVVTP